MPRTLRGRPALNIELRTIISAIRQHRQATAAAEELGCSPAYIHKRLKAAQLTLAQVLEAPDVGSPNHG